MRDHYDQVEEHFPMIILQNFWKYKKKRIRSIDARIILYFFKGRVNDPSINYKLIDTI